MPLALLVPYILPLVALFLTLAVWQWLLSDPSCQ